MSRTRALSAAAALAAAALITGPAPAIAQQPGWQDGSYGTDWYDEEDAWPEEQTLLPQLPGEDPLPPPILPLLPATAQKTVAGRVAMLRIDGRAAIPTGAPKRVREIIRAANQIVGKPYKWGGGHRGLGDTGYDCSGAVSYALIKAGVQRSTMVSGALARAHAAGAGRHVTIYAHSGHVYLEVAGLRLDTSSYADSPVRRGVRWRTIVGKRPGFRMRHPVGL